MLQGSGRRASVVFVVGVAGLGLSADAQPAFSVTRVAQTGDAVADDRNFFGSSSVSIYD